MNEELFFTVQRIEFALIVIAAILFVRLVIAVKEHGHKSILFKQALKAEKNSDPEELQKKIDHLNHTGGCYSPIVDNTSSVPPVHAKPDCDGIEMNPPDRIVLTQEELLDKLNYLDKFGSLTYIQLRDADKVVYLVADRDRALILSFKSKLRKYFKSQILILKEHQNGIN